MAISGFPANTGIFPTKSRYINTSVTISVINTYYTALNITSGAGLVSGIRAKIGTGSTNINIRVTIDDESPEVFGLNDVSQDSQLTSSTSNYNRFLNSFFYFKKSCKIEVANTVSTLSPAYVLVDYALV